jgi:hypothetical protein
MPVGGCERRVKLPAYVARIIPACVPTRSLCKRAQRISNALGVFLYLRSSSLDTGLKSQCIRTPLGIASQPIHGCDQNIFLGVETRTLVGSTVIDRDQRTAQQLVAAPPTSIRSGSRG